MKFLAPVMTFVAAAFLALMLAPASGAQDDGPAIEVDPASIEEAGTIDEVTIKGSGFSIEVFVLQCPGAGGSVEALVEGDPASLCDISNLESATPDENGEWEFVFEDVEVGDCGLVVVAGDLAQTEVGGPELIAVENPAADAECEVVEGDSYDLDAADEEGAEDEEADPASEDDAEGEDAEGDAAEGDDAEGDAAEGDDAEGDEALPETGSETTTMAIVGLTLAAGGAVAISGSRRLARI